jgi:hypothetical protein
MWQTSGDKDCQDILIDVSILPGAELYDAVVQSYTITTDPPSSTYHDQVMVSVCLEKIILHGNRECEKSRMWISLWLQI